MKNVEKSDFGIDIRIKKDDIYKDENISIVAGSKKRRRILTQSMIDRYYQRGLSNDRQYNTALYVYAIYQKTSKRIISSYNSDILIDGQRPYEDINFSTYMDIVKRLDNKLFNIVQHIVIYGFSASEFDNKYNNKRRTMKELKLALDTLGDFFKIR